MVHQCTHVSTIIRATRTQEERSLQTYSICRLWSGVLYPLFRWSIHHRLGPDTCRPSYIIGASEPRPSFSIGLVCIQVRFSCVHMTDTIHRSSPPGCSMRAIMVHIVKHGHSFQCQECSLHIKQELLSSRAQPTSPPTHPQVVNVPLFGASIEIQIAHVP